MHPCKSKLHKKLLLHFKKNVILATKEYIKEIEGIYLIGSYARGEQEKDSDIDILVVTEHTMKKIIYGKYSIKLIPIQKIIQYLKTDAAKIYTMIFEAVPLVNSHLIATLKKTKLTVKSILHFIPELKRNLHQNTDLFKPENIKSKKDSALALDFLMKRLRELYFIMDMLNKKTNYSRKAFVSWIRNESDLKPLEARQIIYGFYRTKRNKPLKKKISPELIQKLHDFLQSQIYIFDNLRKITK